MVNIEILDQTSAAYKKPVSVLVKKLAQHFRLGDFYLEIYLVNNQFMNKNVLSFRAPKKFPRPDLRTSKALGEIYLNPSHIKKHQEDFSLMVIHGFLHLVGYDHVQNRDRIIMEKLEQKLLKQFSNHQ